MSYNIQFGKGMDGLVDLVRISDEIRNTDIVCLQEVEQYWRRSGNIDQAAEIATLLGDFYYVYGSSFDVDASSMTAEGRIINRRRRHGNMILSRWPIMSTRTFNLPKRHYDEKFNMQMGFVEAIIAANSLPVRVYSYHAGYLEPDERIAQIRKFAAVYADSPGEKGAWSGKSDIDGDDWSNQRQTPPLPTAAIVCGDFNANPDTAEYELLIEMTGLVDSWAVSDPDNRSTATIKKEPGNDIRVSGKIDHILLSPDLCDRIEQVAIHHEAEGSDHKPIEVRLDLADR